MSLHPTYDKSDCKAGAPLLIGEEFYGRGGVKETCLGIDKHGYIIVKEGSDDALIRYPAMYYAGPVFSTPPLPQIDACVCGNETPTWNGEDAAVWCQRCNRTGPNGLGSGAENIAGWNVLQRWLKASGR